MARAGGLPPPPGSGSGAGPAGAKLRPLAWNKLRGAVVAQSLWADIKGGASGVRVDVDDIAVQFSVDKPKPVKAATAAAKKKQSAVHHLLDSKRSTNLSIVLSRFKIPNRVIQLSIWCLDEAVLEEDDVSALLTATPTPDEETLLKGHAGSSSDLGKPEQYLIAVSAIPRLQPRLVAWHFMITFPQKLADISEQVGRLRDAIDTVMHSSALVNVLAHFLAAGNFLNEGSFRGGALGVKIGALSLISDCKQTGHATRNLSHSLARAIPKDCAKLLEEFSVVSDARKVDYKFISASAQQLADGLGTVEEEFKATESKDYVSDCSALSNTLGKPNAFPARLSSFMQDAGKQLSTMLAAVGKCGDELLLLCRYFELPSPKVVADCAPFAAEILENLEKLLDRLRSAIDDNAKADQQAARKVVNLLNS